MRSQRDRELDIEAENRRAFGSAGVGSVEAKRTLAALDSLRAAPTRGGPRPGAGRPPRTDTPAARGPEVALTEAERAELTAGLREGETLAGLLREGGLALVRRRR